MSYEDQKLWEEEELDKEVNFEDCKIGMYLQDLSQSWKLKVKTYRTCCHFVLPVVYQTFNRRHFMTYIGVPKSNASSSISSE